MRNTVLAIAVCSVGVGCGPSRMQPTAPENAPPIPNDDGNIEIDELPDDPIVDPVPELDCDALVINAQTVNCSALLGTPTAYCSSVYLNPEQPNFQLVAACGDCDAAFFTPPAGTNEECFGVAEPPPDPVLPESTCKSCHAPSGYDGQSSIEDPHPWASVDCTSCHGGDGTAGNKVFAHVCTPPEIGDRNKQALDPRAFFLSFTHAGVEFLPDFDCARQGGEKETFTAVQWLAFKNPGDLRAGKAGYGCGACHGSGAVGPDGEHLLKGGNVVDYVLKSTMGNATGLNSGSRHGIGAPNKFADRQGNNIYQDWNTQADYGAKTIYDDEFDPDSPDRTVGAVGQLQQAGVFTGQNFYQNPTYNANAVNNSLNVAQTNKENYPNGIVDDVSEQLFQEVLNQFCTGCHLQNKYNNNRAGDYRSAGCTACHFQTSFLGRSSSKDPNVRKDEPYNPNFLTPGEQSHIRDHRVRNVTKFPGKDPVPTVVQGIADQNCMACHAGSNRTVLQFAGVRLDQNADLANNNFYPSQNTVVFTNATELFGENQFFNNRQLNQWIATEIWQNDVNNQLGQAGQDETPDDVHHEAGMGCVDCHSTGATHGRGEIYSRMKAATHANDVLCETCHGTIDEYAPIYEGTHIADQGGRPLTHTYVNGEGAEAEYWLVSKLDGSTHYIPQIRDVVNGNNAAGIGGKQYPPGAARAGQPVFNYVASFSMGRWEATQDLANGFGPEQPDHDPNVFQMQDGFSHSYGTNAGFAGGAKNKGLECYTCHAAWQNNCVGCHLDAFYDGNLNNYNYSQVTGERIYFNANANFVYQNPINFMMGINDRGKITPYQGLHRFFSYTDQAGDTSNRVSYGDRNGLGNDPQLRNAGRNNLPALQNQPFTPHSIRGRYSESKIGGKGCFDCHAPNLNNNLAIIMKEQTPDPNNNLAPFAWDITNIIANEENYANAIPFNVNMAWGLGSNLWQFDANGDPVVDTNNAPVYDLDRIVEATGVTNTSSNHPILEPAYINPDYDQFADTNGAKVARPLTSTVLTRLAQFNNAGIVNVYYYNAYAGTDPNDTGVFAYFLNDYNYVGQ